MAVKARSSRHPASRMAAKAYRAPGDPSERRMSRERRGEERMVTQLLKSLALLDLLVHPVGQGEDGHDGHGAPDPEEPRATVVDPPIDADKDQVHRDAGEQEVGQLELALGHWAKYLGTP